MEPDAEPEHVAELERRRNERRKADPVRMARAQQQRAERWRRRRAERLGKMLRRALGACDGGAD